ncbi:hypothetical protein HPB49_022862 [Dermacentor silvarum]|uniref:Uncharacterized protein n=1 Tax=Dermacentor silvarum TaxID=543639 RepID=A0ACB8E387_DERSI|nr:hypothetical protein HPB49_022862 [Dermacentor silvarum]
MAGDDKKHRDLRVWQWNCRGYRGKKAILAQYLRTQEEKPQVILLQETIIEDVTINGYEVSVRKGENGRGVATCVKRGITTIDHGILDKRSNAEYMCVELLPGRHFRTSFLILNVYSSPKKKEERFYALIAKAASIAAKAGIPLLVAGDFNAPHTTWSYGANTPKGESVVKSLHDHGFTLLTDPHFPTRMGNSVTKPSSPDLTFINYTGQQNMDE